MLSIDIHAYSYILIIWEMLIFGQDGWTALMIASYNGYVDVVNVLLPHGASVHLQDKVKF